MVIRIRVKEMKNKIIQTNEQTIVGGKTNLIFARSFVNTATFISE